MNIQEPKPRYGTGKAIKRLAEALGLIHNDLMQDWSYEIANPDDIEKYIILYDRLTDEDEKFVLMETIIQANTEQSEMEKLVSYWSKTKERLSRDFDLHEYTVYYWSCFQNEDIEDCWLITPYMRELWFSKRNG